MILREFLAWFSQASDNVATAGCSKAAYYDRVFWLMFAYFRESTTTYQSPLDA